MAESREDPSRLPIPRPRPEPTQSIGERFFDDLVSRLYDPERVRRALHRLVTEQHDEAQRIDSVRTWSSSKSYGVDRYEYSKEQGSRLAELLPGAEMRTPNQSLMYAVGDALIYHKVFGHHGSDCPTGAQVDPESLVQVQLASGSYHYTPSLFGEQDERPVVVWLLTTGNRIDGGPLSAYVGRSAGCAENGRIRWLALEPLLRSAEEPPNGEGFDGVAPPARVVPPEPTLSLRLRT